MPSTGNPWRCKTDCTGGNPSDVQDDQKLHKKKAKVPILQHGCKQTSQAGKGVSCFSILIIQKVTGPPEKLKPPLHLLCWKGLVCLHTA